MQQCCKGRNSGASRLSEVCRHIPYIYFFFYSPLFLFSFLFFSVLLASFYSFFSPLIRYAYENGCPWPAYSSLHVTDGDSIIRMSFASFSSFSSSPLLLLSFSHYSSLLLLLPSLYYFFFLTGNRRDGVHERSGGPTTKAVHFSPVYQESCERNKLIKN